MKSRLGNCLVYSIYFWLITPKSRIVAYYNKKYITISFYVVVNNDYKISFIIDREKRRYCKFLFYVYPHFSKLNISR